MYIFIFIVAFLLATAQALWKMAGNDYATLVKNTELTIAIFQTAISAKFIGGAILYIAATAIYIWLFSRYSFFSVQVTLISTSVILSVLISYFIFKEIPSSLNILGIAIILIGITLANLR
jgi:drug/metabolite transporter (DMT)-like permease